VEKKPCQPHDRANGNEHEQSNADHLMLGEGPEHSSTQRCRRLCSHSLNRTEARDEGEEHEVRGIAAPVGRAAALHKLESIHGHKVLPPTAWVYNWGVGSQVGDGAGSHGSFVSGTGCSQSKLRCVGGSLVNRLYTHSLGCYTHSLVFVGVVVVRRQRGCRACGIHRLQRICWRYTHSLSR
jgi:hypothetical protein